MVPLGRRADDWSANAECCGLKASATDLAVSVAQSHRGAPCAGMSSPLRLGVPGREAGRRADSLTHSSRTPTTDLQRTSKTRRLKDGLADWLSVFHTGTVAPSAPGTSLVRRGRNGLNVSVSDGWSAAKLWSLKMKVEVGTVVGVGDGLLVLE